MTRRQYSSVTCANLIMLSLPLRVLLMLVTVMVADEVDSDSRQLVVREGEYMLGFIIDDPAVVSSRAKNLNHVSQNILTFQYSVEKYGMLSEDGGDDIGYVMYTTTDSTSVPDTLYILQQYPNIIAFFGPRTSFLVLSLTSLFSNLRIPTFVYGSSVLADSILEVFQWDCVFPLTATATAQVMTAIPRLTQATGANAVIIISDTTEYAQAQVPLLMRAIKSHDISILQNLEIASPGVSSDPQLIASLIESLVEANAHNRTLTILFLASFRSIEPVMREIHTAATHLEPYSILYFTTTQGCLSEAGGQSNINMIKLCQSYYRVAELEEYFGTIEFWDNEGVPVNAILNKLIVDNGQCVEGDNGCVSNDRIIVDPSASRPYSSYNHRIFYAVRATIEVLKKRQNDEAFLEKLLEHTQEDQMSLTPHSSDDFITAFKEESSQMAFGLQFNTATAPELSVEVYYNNVKLGTWEENGDNEEIVKYLKSQVSGYERRIECSKPCRPGTRKMPLYESSNCWKCVRCQGNKVSQVENADECTECGPNTWTNPGRTNCSVVPTSLSLTEGPHGYIILGLVLLFLVFIIGTFGVYVYLWESVVIVASGRDLAIFMFAGMICGLANAALIASKPSPEVCVAMEILSHLMIILILSPLVVRTLRILVIFKFGVKRRDVVKYVKERAIYVLMFIVSAPVLISLIATFSIERFRFVEQQMMVSYLEPDMLVNLSCAPRDMTLVQFLLGYVLFLLLVSALMGFKTRKLPENYKESMHILLCCLITLALVASSLPALMLLPGKEQVFSLAMIVSILSVAINILIFIPKIYNCLKYPDIDKAQTTRRSAEKSSHHSKNHNSGVISAQNSTNSHDV